MPAYLLISVAVSSHLNIEALTPAFKLGNSEGLRGLLESAGFMDVALFFRSFIVREPYNPRIISRLPDTVGRVVAAFLAMDVNEWNNLAQAIEAEIRPKLTSYVDGDEQLCPISSRIAVGHKP